MSSSENDSFSLEEKSSSASKRRLEKVVKSSQAGTSHSLSDKSSDSLGLGQDAHPPFLENHRVSQLIDSLLDEFADELILLKSIPSGIDETDCDPEEEIHLIKKLLYDNSYPGSPEEFISKNSDAAIEFFSPSPILVEDSNYLMKEINLSFTPDDLMPPGIENDDYDSKVDMLILEELLSNDSLSLFENESFDFDIPSSSHPPVKPLDDDSKILTVKVVDDISELYVPMPRLLPTQTTLVSNQEKSPPLLSHRGLKAFQLLSESPMMIYGGHTPILDVPFLHFYPP
nr:hypothetical protein [Tanacetum cinerariifolium]